MERKQVFHALMKIASRRADGKINFDPEITGGVYFGTVPDWNGEEGERTVCRIAELFGQTRVRYTVYDDIIKEQWRKFQVNICYNIPQALLDVGYGAYFHSEHVESMVRALESELIAVAAAEDIDLAVMPLEPQGYNMSARYSTLQDLDAKRHTEIDMFLGVIMEKGEKAGIQTPVSAFTYHAIKALEEKNDGLFSF